jgi:putative thiazole/oxazole-modified microcin (TOMM)-like peptide
MDENTLAEPDRKRFARLVAQAWAEDDLTARYQAQPRTVLGEYGIHLTDDVATPVLPPRPDGEFSLEQLEAVAGSAASTFGTVGSVSCPAASTGSI